MKGRAWRWMGSVYIILFLAFMLAPMFFIVVNSFNDAASSAFPPKSFSLRWYHNLFAIEEFYVAMRNSALVAVSAMLVSMAMGTGVALAIVRGDWRRREMVQSMFLAPLLVPRIVIGIAIFIVAIQVSLYPSLASLVVAHSILLLPYIVSILVANLMQVKRVQEEAAMDLGANAWQTFWHATVPQIARGMAVAAIFAFILSFDEFDLSLFLTRSQNTTLPIRMFLFMQEQDNPTMAALSTMLIALAGIAVAAIAYVSRGSDLMSLARRRAG